MKNKKKYFIGIKGSGMSSLAQILHDNGYEVTGSDIESYIFTEEELRKREIEIKSFNKKNISSEYEYVIGNAFNDSNCEVKEVMKKGLPYKRYHEFLGLWMNNFISIAISGTHGKTSTTSLLSHTLAKLEPTSTLIGDGTGSGVKDSKYFVMEACEYKRHFLSYKPDYAIITNIEFDHPDYFLDEDDVVNSFEDFARKTKKTIVVYGDDDNCRKIISSLNKQSLTYGLLDSNDITAKNIYNDQDFTYYDLYVNGEKVTEVSLPQHGKHSILNSLAVLSIFHLEGINLEVAANQLLDFKGAKRRFQVEDFMGQKIINDYAHHPTEISATIEAAKARFTNQEIVAIFQPHTFTRTNSFLKEFQISLSKADYTYGCEIFGSAREKVGNVSVIDILKEIENSKEINLNQISDLDEHNNAVLLFMGAGDIEKYIDKYKEYKKSKNN